MNEHERPGDPAFDRLAAADPARQAPEPVEGVLRAKVDALIARAEDRPEPAPRTTPGPADRPARDELAVRRHRRRSSWLVAAAVAGVVVVGGGGYLAGEAGLGPSAADSGAAPASESVGDTGSEDTADQPSVLGAPESDVGPRGAAGDLPEPTGVVFHAGVGLSDTPGTGEVRVDGTSESLGSYPVISEVAAVERLGDPRFAGSVLGPRPDDGASSGGAPVPGGAIAWPVQDVTVVSATRTEARHTLPDGTVLVVPAYRLADAEGSAWTVIAVDEELLDFAP
ncbi:hypothetical protein ACFQHV_06365 [Promicromonospora thailandica]|uniref:Uncharacterized protein n=1 Tax=Promicromonospora thailandica TaxID=765201 RepID=A0A9X2GD81_9MICO|nr:hypothetical protein [Promicromonospora thailandica]MCP2266436.1 hypothetical protein [Promicromonospora thailandica]